MLVPCAECKKEVSNKAKTCPFCGFPLSAAESKVIVHGPTQPFIFSSTIEVSFNGSYIGAVNSGAQFEFPISQDGTLVFKCGFRSATIKAYAKRVNSVRLEWNRLSGALVAYDA